MKKIIALFLAFSLIFSFAACSNEKPDTNQESLTDTETNKNDNGSDNNDAQSLKLLDIYSVEYSDNEWDDVNNVMLANVNVDYLVLPDDTAKQYPKLAEAIEELGEESVSYADEELESFAELAIDELSYSDPEYFNGYTYETKYSLQRADENVVSVRSDWYSFSGGVHPNYGATGYNFDSKTGKELNLSDIVTDRATLEKLIIDELTEENPDEFFDNLEDTLGEYTDEKFSWSINCQSITFYFSPYEIASYAAGLLTATFYFDDYPELFNEQYTKAPENYAYTIPSNEVVSVDIDENDGKTDKLLFSYISNEDDMIDSMTVTLNGKAFSFDGLEVFRGTNCLVHSNGKNYIYFESYGYNDYCEITVFELNTGSVKKVDVCQNIGFDFYYINGEEEYETYTAKRCFNNPTVFELQTRFDFLGTYRGNRNYTVDTKTGMPVSTEKSYEVEMYNQFALTSKIPLEVEILPDKKSETLPAGTDFKIIATDGETYVDTSLEDGRECRIYATQDDYKVYVNGVWEYEAFEEIMYAG